jgi:hypothetical protein
MNRENMLPEDLFAAIDLLTNPIRVRTDPDDDTSDMQTTPSLWDQLLLSTPRTSQGGSSAKRSRPPVSTDVLSLIHEVRRLCADQLHAHSRELRYRPDTRVRDTPSELRAINTLLVPKYPTAAITWAWYVWGWQREALRVLGLLPPHITLPRDARCMDCTARDVTEWNSYCEPVVAPALRLLWADDGRVLALWCAACGQSRPPNDLHLLAAQLADCHDNR